nr:helix-turn-helix transcriptional regulator [Clostridia bacterium]
MKIGENIRALRVQKGLTQEQVAARLGVSYQAVSKWETAANTPDISLLPALAELFGVTIDALFSREGLPALELPCEDDGIIRIVQLRGRQVLSVTPRMSPDDPPIEIAFPRNCNDRTQYVQVEVYGHVISDGSINGTVVAHQSVDCGDINGDVHVQGDVRASGINACGNIVCSGIYDCYNLQADRIECSGSVNSANLTCGQITYKHPPEQQ